MKLIKVSLLLCCCLLLEVAGAQTKKPPKVADLFMNYMGNALKLQPEEKKKMSPLVRNYLNGRKKVYRANADPLEREAQIVRLKKNYRAQFSKVIGFKRANSFFSYEQQFRRKVREELRERKRKNQKN